VPQGSFHFSRACQCDIGPFSVLHSRRRDHDTRGVRSRGIHQFEGEAHYFTRSQGGILEDGNLE